VLPAGRVEGADLKVAGARRNILISTPGKVSSAVYLPTVWGILKSYGEQRPAIRESYSWLDPVVIKSATSTMLAPYRDVPIDVLGLSCYCWNTASNFALARAVKERNPDCLVVVGGPDPDYRQPGFFAAHPYIDALVLRDGEGPFTSLLEQALDGVPDFDSIPGLVLPPRPGDGEPYRFTGEQKLSQEFGYQPWIAQSDYYARVLDELRGPDGSRQLVLSWETDRGCPYKCSFCDWGSATHSKVRRIDMERLAAEAEWIGEHRIEVVSFTSANFGIFERDLDIIDLLIAVKERTGYPKLIHLNNAKNNVEWVTEINRRAFRAGLIDFHTLSVQSLSEEVLAAMDRSNIRKERQLAMLRALHDDGVPNVVQLIFGGPRDSLECFRSTLTDLMEFGVHEEFVCYPFMVLPNAPANDPAYRAKWGIRTIERYGTVTRRSRSQPLADGADRYVYIVETDSYGRDEYVDMYCLGRAVIALHNSGLLQFIARFLRQGRGLPYKELYGPLLQGFFADAGTLLGEVYQRCHRHVAAFVAEGAEHEFEQMPVDELPGFDALLNVEEYMMFRWLSEAPRVYAELREALRPIVGDDALLDSLLSFQAGMVITPDYDRRIGRELLLQHDWPGFFSESHRYESTLEEPRSLVPPRRAHIHQEAAGSHLDKPLDWLESGADAREAVLARWLDSVVASEYARVQRTYFRIAAAGEATPQ
jgi:putative methyltransferase